MQIVIDIPEEEYKRMKEKSMFGRVDVWKDAIRNGTPLPKGHGDLKDIVKIEEAFWNNNLIDKNMDSIDNGESQKIRRAMIRTMYLDVPTIIEADKEDLQNE